MALDEATTGFLTEMAKSGFPPIHEMTPTEARGLTAALREMYGPGPDMHRVADDVVSHPGGQVPVRTLVPTGTPRGTIVYYHGGGWVIGALDEFDTLGRELAARTGCAVVLVDYRLAPEDPHPAAVDDAWAALQWVASSAADIAGAGAPLVVAGDSAGGNLAAIVAQRARDEGGPDLAMQILVYPVTDCDFDRPSYVDPENQLMLSRDGMIWFWDHYAPDGAGRSGDTTLCPLNADDLAGLPPAVVLLAEHDPLLDEGRAYADALRDAGVPVEQRLFDGQMHGFFTMVNVLPASITALDHVAAAVEARLAEQPA